MFSMSKIAFSHLNFFSTAASENRRVNSEFPGKEEISQGLVLPHTTLGELNIVVFGGLGSRGAYGAAFQKRVEKS